ncbi:MAG: hypothetical protein RL172_3287 [Bacteroidota bacterium]
MTNKHILLAISLLLITAATQPVLAQPSWTIDLLGKEKKPEKFAERKLGSEKMADKKFTLYRRFVQNSFTHYNYYYNANNKIAAVIERAKEAQKDNYAQLIAYYPYTLDNTFAQKSELDSVIYKATAGILLHDLRNDWIDNMYLLMGKAYFLRKDFDSAATTFQFINYNLFPRKKNEDYNRVIGTTDDADKSRISIANKEKQNILQKVTAKPPSRNDALLWLARTLIEQNELGEAAGLIHTLQNDPNLPERLQPALNELDGYWFYQQNQYDSAAVYLEKGLANAATKQDKARAEYLLGQLFEIGKQYDKAEEYYNKASVHTTNPLIDIYAQLNNAKMRKGNNLKELDMGIANLIKLTRRDKFTQYRDVLYFSAGELALEKPDTTEAIGYYTKSYQLNEKNTTYKNKAFLRLADIAYQRKDYKSAYAFYDSLQSDDPDFAATDMELSQIRRAGLSKIVEKYNIIDREDSLQTIAAMEPAKREAFVKKLSKKLRKERGLTEEDLGAGTTDLVTFDSKKETTDLFQANSSKSGEWYFYNAALKSKGYSDFRRKWGGRPNTDNWRRKDAAATAARTNENVQNNLSMNPDETEPDKESLAQPADTKSGKQKNVPNTTEQSIAEPEDISYEGMMANLPLTPEKLAASNHLLAVNIFELGKLFHQELEDYQQAISTFDYSLQRYPDSVYNGDIYFQLYYCYYKLGNQQKAAYYKNLLEKNFASTPAAKLLTNPLQAKSNAKNPAATQQYQDIYTLFIEGKFSEALAQKKIADSLYGTHYWSPQLLYIEAVYHVKQKNDTAAIAVLNNIVNLYPNSALKPKAKTMIEVLGRRKEIEEYLTNLQIERAKEDETILTPMPERMVRNDSNLIVSPKPQLLDTSRITIKTDNITAIKDSAIKAPEKIITGPYVFNAANIHNVIMWLDKVDATYVNESKNAFARFVTDNYRGASITVAKEVMDTERALLVFASFANAEEALQFYQKIKKAAPDEVSWLPANKYAFYIIDNDNLERLRTTKDLDNYRKLMNKEFPGTFK